MKTENLHDRSETAMLERFGVENFMGFSEFLEWDLTAHNYNFNQNLVYNGVVNKAIVYGKNGVGKSALGMALFDITTHLTDNHKKTVKIYRNLHHPDKPVRFQYQFKFGNDRVVYEYLKANQSTLFWELLEVNGERLIEYFHFDELADRNFVHPSLKGTLNIEPTEGTLSVLKYIYRNTPINPESPLTKLMQFCNNMLWYRSLSDGNSFMGFTPSFEDEKPTDIIQREGKLAEFEEFLRSNDVNYQLGFEEENDKYVLYAYFNDGKNKAPFTALASTGTKMLLLYYAWSLQAYPKLSLLFIDEFDAFLHYEAAERLVKLLNNAEPRFQSILTTHNTYLMQNRLTRPDCCFLMSNNRITNLRSATDKEIREAHNLEKMYINGAFVEP